LRTRDKILEECRVPKTFKELKGVTGLSDAGLSKALKALVKEGLLTKTEMGYVITERGGLSSGERTLVIGGMSFVYRGVNEETLRKIAELLKGMEDFHICVGRTNLVPNDELKEVLLLALDTQRGREG